MRGSERQRADARRCTLYDGSRFAVPSLLSVWLSQLAVSDSWHHSPTLHYLLAILQAEFALSGVIAVIAAFVSSNLLR